MSKCQFCGEEFTKTHFNQKYCSDECRSEMEKVQSRNRFHKWYHKHKHELDEKRRWGLGSGTLGPHRHNDFTKEQNTIHNELTRLRLK